MHVSPLRPTYCWFCVLFLPRLPTTCSPLYLSLSVFVFFFRQLCTHLNREILFHAKKQKPKPRAAKGKETEKVEVLYSLRMRTTERQREGERAGRREWGGESTCAGVSLKLEHIARCWLEQGNQLINYKFGLLQLQPSFQIGWCFCSLLNGYITRVQKFGNYEFAGSKRN